MPTITQDKKKTEVASSDILQYLEAEQSVTYKDASFDYPVFINISLSKSVVLKFVNCEFKSYVYLKVENKLFFHLDFLECFLYKGITIEYTTGALSIRKSEFKQGIKVISPNQTKIILNDVKHTETINFDNLNLIDSICIN